MTMDASLFTFAYDVADEGADAVVANVVDRAGANGVLMAVTYHDGRDVFPHGRTGHIRYLEPGSTFFRPNLSLYRESAIKPRVAQLAATRDPLDALVAAAHKRSAKVHAWTVFLHHDRIGEHLEYTPRNAFGDAIQTDLCASNPAAQTYARALASDVASRGVHTVLAEALQFFPLEHGVHHERYFLSLGPLTRFLMGLCFCEWCIDTARGRHGVDGAALQRWARSEIQRAFDAEIDDPPRELNRAEVAALAGGDMGGYLAMREGVITGLTAEIRHVVAQAGVRLAFLDPSGAYKGYATGRPTGDPSPTIAWQLGLDLAGLAGASDEIEILGYAADSAWVERDITTYRAVLGEGPSIAVGLRPTAPDSTTAEDLGTKVQAAARTGVTRVDFYHYGLMRLDALDRIREALGGDRR